MNIDVIQPNRDWLHCSTSTAIKRSDNFDLFSAASEVKNRERVEEFCRVSNRMEPDSEAKQSGERITMPESELGRKEPEASKEQPVKKEVAENSHQMEGQQEQGGTSCSQSTGHSPQEPAKVGTVGNKYRTVADMVTDAGVGGVLQEIVRSSEQKQVEIGGRIDDRVREARNANTRGMRGAAIFQVCSVGRTRPVIQQKGVCTSTEKSTRSAQGSCDVANKYGNGKSNGGGSSVKTEAKETTKSNEGVDDGCQG